MKKEREVPFTNSLPGTHDGWGYIRTRARRQEPSPGLSTRSQWWEPTVGAITVAS